MCVWGGADAWGGEMWGQSRELCGAGGGRHAALIQRRHSSAAARLVVPQAKHGAGGGARGAHAGQVLELVVGEELRMDEGAADGSSWSVGRTSHELAASRPSTRASSAPCRSGAPPPRGPAAPARWRCGLSGRRQGSSWLVLRAGSAGSVAEAAAHEQPPSQSQPTHLRAAPRRLPAGPSAHPRRR